MDQCLIHSDSHDSEDSYHRWKRKIISGDSENDNSSSYRQEYAGNDDDGIFDIIELDDQHEDHKDESDKHGFA